MATLTCTSRPFVPATCCSRTTAAAVFRDVTAQSGTGYAGHSSSAVFFDYDADGLARPLRGQCGPVHIGAAAPDVGRCYRWATHTSPDSYEFPDGLEDAFEGHLYPDRSESSVLYRNLGGGRFADVTEEAGLADAAWSGDATPLDVNGDGLSDLYVLNMQGHDRLYENVGGRFVLSEDAFCRGRRGARWALRPSTTTTTATLTSS